MLCDVMSPEMTMDAATTTTTTVFTITVLAFNFGCVKTSGTRHITPFTPRREVLSPPYH